MGSVVNGSIITAKLKAELGTVGNNELVLNKLEQFSQFFSMRFLIWSASTLVQNVLGRGPVPSFAPPFTPVGQVMNGSVISVPGVLIGNKF